MLRRCAFVVVFAVALVWPAVSQVSTNFSAKQQLRDWGVYSTKMIENAEQIIIEGGSITPEGGISVDLPILQFIGQDQIVLLAGASGYITPRGTIVIEADLLYISAVVITLGRQTYLVVGQDLKAIVNWLLDS